MNIIIRKAKESDALSICKILTMLGWFDDFKAIPEHILTHQIQQHIALSYQDNNHTLLVAEDFNHHVVGYGAVHWLPTLFLSWPEGYVSELFVSDKERGKGIVTKLLNTIKQEAESRSCPRLVLITSKNRESYHRRFYEKQGWAERAGVTNFVYTLETK